MAVLLQHNLPVAKIVLQVSLAGAFAFLFAKEFHVKQKKRSVILFILSFAQEKRIQYYWLTYTEEEKPKAFSYDIFGLLAHKAWTVSIL